MVDSPDDDDVLNEPIPLTVHGKPYKPGQRRKAFGTPFYDALKDLAPDEKTFVKHLLLGLSPDEASQRAFRTQGQDSQRRDFDSAGYHLAKPTIQAAIKAGISRVSDPRIAYHLLSLIAIQHALSIIESGTNQERITMIRDIWDRAGYVAVHKSESKRLDVKGILSDIQARRLKAQGS